MEGTCDEFILYPLRNAEVLDPKKKKSHSILGVLYRITRLERTYKVIESKRNNTEKNVFVW